MVEQSLSTVAAILRVSLTVAWARIPGSVSLSREKFPEGNGGAVYNMACATGEELEHVCLDDHISHGRK